MTYRSIRSAAGELGISQLSVRRAIHQGRIPAVEVGGVWRIPSSYFEELEARAYSRLQRSDVLVPPRFQAKPERRLRNRPSFDDDLPDNEIMEFVRSDATLDVESA